MTADQRGDVLIVDDHENARKQLRGVLEDEGYRVTDRPDATAALAAVEEGRFDVVLMDVNMPGMDGLTATARVKETDPNVQVVIVTGESYLKNAGDIARKIGAFDLLVKPPEPEELKGVVQQAVDVTRAARRVAERPIAPGPAEAELGLVGRSAALLALVEQIRRVAPSQGRVLITGENGSGKELVAEAIHRLSKRAAGPFVKLNCAAIPKDLVESELFGYERGAFTGAQQSKKGRIELADQGTLFLDEIGDLSQEAQAKLLRAIETGEAERLGGTRTDRFDVRYLAATNKDLAAAIDAGDFRQDLFYRLNVLPLAVPPLRERRGDIPVLARHFLERFCEAEGKPPKRLNAESEALLEEYVWPGNVRELRNLMERAAILIEDDEVTAEDLNPWLEAGGSNDGGVGLRGEIERREADAIRKALEGAHWNVTQAAAGLGIDRTNLHRKMRKYGIARR
jgi:two-component system nitrogen regulation response regulator NtrX